MSRLQILCCTGAAGTGKTTFIEKLQKELQSKNLNVRLSPSIVRDFYISKGLTKEQDFIDIANSKEGLAFQLALIDRYIFNFIEQIILAKASNVQVILFDRTILDHIAYTLTTNNHLLTTEQKVILLSKLEFIFKNYTINLVKFDFPTPWSNSDAVEDGFRAVDFTKELDIDANIQHLIDSYKLKTMHYSDENITNTHNVYSITYELLQKVNH